MARSTRPGSATGFAEHYLRHIALGEGCNCAESVLRNFAQAPHRGEQLADLLRALKTRFYRLRFKGAKPSHSGER